MKPQNEEGESTKGLSREHTVLVSRSGLVTVTGGKWTTYRAMAEDVLANCISRKLIDSRPSGITARLRLIGAGTVSSEQRSICEPQGLHSYGDEQPSVMNLPGAHFILCEGLTEAMVRFAARYEYAVHVEDILARRSRLLFLDAKLAGTLAERVSIILQEETGLDPKMQSFSALAEHYQYLP